MSDRTERSILVSTSASHAICHYFEFVFPAMTMFIARDLDVDTNKVIASGLFLYLFYGLFALPWGLFADRTSSRIALGSGLLVVSIGAFIVSFATSISFLMYSLALIGVGIAAVHPAAMALITKTVKKRGRALGIFGIWGSVGITFAPFIGGVAGYYFGWRNLYFVSGVAALIFSLLTFRVKIDETSRERTEGPTERSHKLIRVSFVVLLGCMTLAGLNYRGNSVTLPIYIEEQATEIIDSVLSTGLVETGGQFFKEGNDQTMIAGLLFSGLVFVALLGQLLGGYVADRFDLRYGYLAFFSVCLPILLAMAYASNFSMLALGALFFFFSLGMQPIENTLVATLTPNRLRSTAYGIKFVLAFGLGSMATKLVPLVREPYGTSAVYYMLAGIQLLLIISILSLIFVTSKIKGKSFKE